MVTYRASTVYLALACSTLLFGCGLFGDEGIAFDLSGRIVSESDGEPIPGATVRLEHVTLPHYDVSVLSDSDGRYSIKHDLEVECEPTAIWLFHVEAEGYQSVVVMDDVVSTPHVTECLREVGQTYPHCTSQPQSWNFVLKPVPTGACEP